MIKVLLILSTLVAGAAIYFGIQNKNSYTEHHDARVKAESTDAKVQRELASVREELEDFGGQLTSGTEQRDLAQAQKEQKETKLNLNRQELARQNRDMLDKQSKIDELRIQIEQAGEDLPAGLDLAEIPGMVEDLKVREDELQAELQEKRTLVAAAVNRTKNSETILKSLQAQEADYQRAIARNSIELAVSAVNNDWKFVVINTPRGTGIQSGASMMVKRGEQYIARLTVDKVEPSQIVANIESITEGMRILPGDRVIFEDPQDQ
jgi:chromosome segregation ATPase